MDPVDHLVSRRCEALRIRAEELNAHRAFGFREFQVSAGAGITVHDAIGRDELGGEDIGPFLPADCPENRIRDPGHRGEEERQRAVFHDPVSNQDASGEDPGDESASTGPATGWVSSAFGVESPVRSAETSS